MRLTVHQEGDPADAGHGPGQESDGSRLTVVAEEDTGVVGRGTLRLLELHRERYSVEIEVEPGHRRRGVGRALFEELQRRKAAPYPLMARAMASQPQRRAFAEALGFVVLAECPAPQVDPSSAEVRAWVAGHRAPDGIRVVPATEVAEEAALDAWAHYYTWVHDGWAPAAPFDVVRAHLAATVQSEPGRNVSLVAVTDDGHVAGVGELSLEVWDGRTFALCETARRDEPRGAEVVGAVVAALLHAADAAGVPLVELEGHDSDAHISVIRSVPAVASDPLTLLGTRD